MVSSCFGQYLLTITISVLVLSIPCSSLSMEIIHVFLRKYLAPGRFQRSVPCRKALIKFGPKFQTDSSTLPSNTKKCAGLHCWRELPLQPRDMVRLAIKNFPLKIVSMICTLHYIGPYAIIAKIKLHLPLHFNPPNSNYFHISLLKPLTLIRFSL